MTALGEIDKALFLILNGFHNSCFDIVMQFASNRFAWIPLYILLLWLIIKTFKKKSIIIVLSIVFIIALSDQFSVMIKNMVLRPRPCHNEMLAQQIHINGNCGGYFGFVSSHAANTFALALFLSFLLRRKYNYFPPLIFSWAVFVSYSRIYNGVHYPFDIISGALLGLLISFSIYTVVKSYIYIK